MGRNLNDIEKLPEDWWLPRWKDGRVAPIKPLKVRNGIVHLHYIEIKSTWIWVARINASELCGTPRCVRLEIKHGSFSPVCEHDWRPAPWGTMVCSDCGNVGKFDIKIVSVEPGVTRQQAYLIDEDGLNE